MLILRLRLGVFSSSASFHVQCWNAACFAGDFLLRAGTFRFSGIDSDVAPGKCERWWLVLRLLWLACNPC